MNNADATFCYRPMKKKGGGTLAGIPRASGERNSPVGNGAFSNNQVSTLSFVSSSIKPFCLLCVVVTSVVAIAPVWGRGFDGLKV